MAFLRYVYAFFAVYFAFGSAFQICSSTLIVTARVGDSAVLSCHFSYGKSTDNLTAIWKKSTGAEAIVVYDNGKTVSNQSADYYNRTAMLEDWFQRKDAALTVERVRSEDAGEYTCWVVHSPSSPIPEHKCCTRRLDVARERNGDTKQLIVAWSIYFSFLSLVSFLLFGCSRKKPRLDRLEQI